MCSIHLYHPSLTFSSLLFSDQAVVWHYLRIIIVVLLILNEVIYMASRDVPNVTKCLIPVLFIARRDNYRFVFVCLVSFLLSRSTGLNTTGDPYIC